VYDHDTSTSQTDGQTDGQLAMAKASRGKNRMIISVVAAKIWYLKKCAVFIGPPCRYDLMGEPTSLVTLSYERLTLKTWVNMQVLLIYYES